MKAFIVRWRSPRKAGETEIFAEENVGSCLVAALETGGGMAVWEAGTLWKCPGCGDRTVRTEEFLEGLRRTQDYLQNVTMRREIEGLPADKMQQAALAWLADIAVRMFGCERDRVYIKDEGSYCSFAAQTYISRI